MKKKSLIKSPLIFVVTFVMLFVSCSIERNLADAYLTSKNKDTLYIGINPHIIRTCYKSESIDNTDMSESESKLTSENSCFALPYFQDSIILKQLTQNYLGELFNYPIVIKFVNAQTPDIKKPNQYYFNIVQIQIEEYETFFADSTFSDTAVHYFSVPITAVNFNTWFEVIHCLKDSTIKQSIYFSQLIYKEKVVGKFVKNKVQGTYEFKFKINPLSLGVAHWFVKYSALKNAQYVFDYILNKNIGNNLKGIKTQKHLFHYSRNINKLVKVNKQRLVEIDE